MSSVARSDRPPERLGDTPPPSDRFPSVRLRALRWMLTGFLMSVLGSALIDGASPGLVAAGLLPVAWLALLTTVEMALDLTSPLAVRVIERVDPGRLLVLVEAVDSVACTVCLVLLLVFRVPAAPLLVAYLLAAAALPLVVDIAEELYVAQVGRGDAASVIRFNAMAFSATAAIALLVARPLGALLSGAALPVLFAANLGLSLGAVGTRWRATRLVPTPAPASAYGEEEGGNIEDRAGGPPPAGQVSRASRGRWREWRANRVRLGLVSPPISGVLSFIGGICGYLPLWLAGRATSPSSALALALAGLGLGRVIGPITASRAAASMGLRRALPASVVGLSGILGVTLVASLGTGAEAGNMGPVLVLFVLLGVASAGSLTLLISLRQTELPGNRLARVTGRAHAFSAGGSIAGAWAGVALGVPHRPLLGLALSTATAALLAVWLIRQGGSVGAVAPVEGGATG